MTEKIFQFVREYFGLSPNMYVDQFLSKGYASPKLKYLVELIIEIKLKLEKYKNCRLLKRSKEKTNDKAIISSKTNDSCSNKGINDSNEIDSINQLSEVDFDDNIMEEVDVEDNNANIVQEKEKVESEKEKVSSDVRNMVINKIKVG